MTLPIYPRDKSSDKSSVAWPFLFVFLALIFGNNLFTKISLLLCLIYFAFVNRLALVSAYYVLLRSPGLVLFQVWAAASITWSVVPKVTLDLVLTQLAFCVLAFLMAYDVIKKNLGRTLKYAVITLICFVALFAILFPGAAVSPNGFKAFYANKNNLGIVMAISILVMLYAEKPRWFDYLIASMAFVFLILSQSKTSLTIAIACILIVGLSGLFKSIHKDLEFSLQGLISVLGRILTFMIYALVISLVYFRDYIAGGLIKIIPYDFLTGRGELWVTVLRRTEADLLWGLGPGSFWQAGALSEIAQTTLLTKYPLWIEKLGSADGGYIDIIGSLGFVGLALLLCSIVNSFRNLLFLDSRYVNLFMSFVTFFALHNLTETTAYHSTNSLWFIFMFSTFYIVLSGLDRCRNDISSKHSALPIEIKRRESDA